MKTRTFFVFLALCATNAVNANVGKKSAVLPRSKKALPKPIKTIQPGGAGPFKNRDIAKFATVISILNTGLIALAPVKTLAMYGLDHTPLTEYLTEWIGHISAGQSITMWSLYFGGASINKAVGAGIFYLIVFTIKSLLNGMPKAIGFSAAGQYVFLAINAFCGHALLTDSSYAKTVLKAYPIWGIVNSLLFCFAPDIIGQKWGLQGNALVTYQLKQTGYVMATKAVYLLSLAMGVETTKALGYSSVASLAGMLITNFVTKDVESVGMSPNMQYAFMLLKTFFIGTLAFD
jgi:hypothetical protein